MSPVVRDIALTDVEVTILIAHSHLAPEARVENSEHSRERLILSAKVWFESQDRATNFDGVFNYSPVYQAMRAIDGRLFAGPLEAILDEVLDAVTRHARATKVSLVAARVWLQRPELLQGNVTLSSARVILPDLFKAYAQAA